MKELAIQRLAHERRIWRKEHPPGFIAKPNLKQDGSSDLLVWKCVIPGPQGTDWEGGMFPLTMEFSEEFPIRPPKCKFPKGFYHPNVYPSGAVCLTILNEEKEWRPTTSIKQILLSIQDLLKNPNIESPAQIEPFEDITNDKETYSSKIIKQKTKYRQETIPDTLQ